MKRSWIRRLAAAKKRTALQTFKQTQPIGTGRSIDQDKAREERKVRKIRRDTHTLVWIRDKACVLCGGRRRDECRGFDDEMNHEPPLSLTRGLPEEERTNTRTCGRLCKGCHDDVHAGRIAIAFVDKAQGFDGGVVGAQFVMPLDQEGGYGTAGTAATG